MLGRAAICSSDGDGLASISAAIAMMKPGSHAPHIVTCSASHACWTGCVPLPDSPSMVVIVAPSSSRNATEQLVTARPSTITAQAPQSRLSQPYLVPVRFDASRSAHSKGVAGSSLYSTPSPLTVIFAMTPTLACPAVRCQDALMPRIATQFGYSIGYDEAGSGDASPIVFLHGVGSDKSAWRPQLTHFGATRRAIAFDYPGYGDSDPAPEGTTRDDYAVAILSA